MLCNAAGYCCKFPFVYQGIAYEIDVRTFDCEMRPLDNKSWDVAETDDHHHIRMRTTEEFLRLNHKDYIYEGVTNLRGIPADIFSTKFPGRRNPELMVSFANVLYYALL